MQDLYFPLYNCLSGLIVELCFVVGLNSDLFICSEIRRLCAYSVTTFAQNFAELVVVQIIRRVVGLLRLGKIRMERADVLVTTSVFIITSILIRVGINPFPFIYHIFFATTTASAFHHSADRLSILVEVHKILIQLIRILVSILISFLNTIHVSRSSPAVAVSFA